MQKKVNDGIIKGAFSLGIGAFLAKLLGALYRIPLTNLLGGAGMGLYQTVFPVYALLLDFSGAGTPTAFSKIISSINENKEKNAFLYLQTGKRLLFVLGLIFSLFMAIFAKPISTLQSNPSAYLGYVFLSPAVLLVCLLSCYRGYFQGLMNMTPTALSQIVEQIAKLIFGLTLVFFFRSNLLKSVAGATFAITLAEFFALLSLYFAYKRREKELNLHFCYQKEGEIKRIKKLIKYSLPVVMVNLLIPLSQVIDSFLIVNILSKYRSDGNVLYGILSGVVLTIINLPVSICYGISTSTMPSVSSAKNQEEKNRRIEKSLILTLAVCLPSVLCVYFFSPTIINILYRSLPIFEKQTAIKLLKITCPCILLLSLIQTQNATFIAINKLYLPSITLAVGVAIKTVVNVVLLKNPTFNVYGGGFGLIACYFFTCLVNLIIIFCLKVKNARQTLENRQYAN